MLPIHLRPEASADKSNVDLGLGTCARRASAQSSPKLMVSASWTGFPDTAGSERPEMLSRVGLRGLRGQGEA